MNPNISRLSHVGLQTSDLEVSLEWYTKVLGLTPAFTLVNDGKPWIVYLHVTDTTFIELFAPRPGMGAVSKGHLAERNTPRIKKKPKYLYWIGFSGSTFIAAATFSMVAAMNSFSVFST